MMIRIKKCLNSRYRITCCGKSPFSIWEFIKYLAARCNGSGSLSACIFNRIYNKIACTQEKIEVSSKWIPWYAITISNTPCNWSCIVRLWMKSSCFNIITIEMAFLFFFPSKSWRLLAWYQSILKTSGNISLHVSNEVVIRCGVIQCQSSEIHYTCPASMRDNIAHAVFTTWALFPSIFEYVCTKENIETRAMCNKNLELNKIIWL